MADLTDVTAYLAQKASDAVYPNGILQPSVTAADVRVFEGWPVAEQLDRDIAAGKSNVSVYPMRGTGNSIYQIQDETYTIVPVSYGMAPSVLDNVITVGGQPHAGEYLTLICDGNIVFSQTGASTAALLAALAAQALPTYPGVVATATTLTIPVGHSLVVRQGGVATLGRVTHRQKHTVMISVWAPGQDHRKKLAIAVDVLLKASIRVTLPDTSQAIICYNRTDTDDERQVAGIYRRDLIYEVDYATLLTFPGYVVTSVGTTIASAAGNAQAVAIT